MVDHSRSQRHGRMFYSAGFFRVTHATGFIHCFQIAGIFNQADMSGILAFGLGVASVALDARERMAGVHGRVRLMAFDAISRVIARNFVGNMGRTSPTMWGRVLRMRLYPPREGALIEVGWDAGASTFLSVAQRCEVPRPTAAVVTNMEMAIASLICNVDFINKGVLIL